MPTKTRTGIERVARLEVKADSHEKQLNQIVESFTELVEEVHKIRLKLEKSISFIGGISFTFSMFGAAFGAAVIYGLKKVGIGI